MKKVVIAGGGLAGLTCAWKLSEAGFVVELFESERDLGGLASSVVSEGYIFDFGIHGIFPSHKGNEKIVETIKHLMKDELGLVNKKTAIYLNGKYFSYPLGFRGIFTALNPLAAFLCFIDFVYIRIKCSFYPRQMRQEKSFRDWIVNRFGRQLYKIYFGPYAFKAWGVKPSLLDASQICRRVTTVSIWSVIFKAIKKKLRLTGERNYPQQPPQFLYSKRGTVEICKRLKEEILYNGGRIHTESRVVGVEHGSGSIKSIKVSDGKSVYEVSGDEFIFTIPLTTLKDILDLNDKNAEEAVAGLKYRSIIFVFLKVNKSRVSDYQWMYYSHSNIVFTRANEFSNIFPEYAPPGKSSFCVEITCFKEDKVWNLDDKAIYEKCINDLEKLAILKREDVEGVIVYKMDCGYPIVDLQARPRLSALFAALNKLNNLYLCGRQAAFTYINMDEVIEGAFGVINKIKERHNDTGL